jgi:hypothetical protein
LMSDRCTKVTRMAQHARTRSFLVDSDSAGAPERAHPELPMHSCDESEMTELEYEARQQAAQEFFAKVFEREVDPTDYGFCAYGDASPAIGGGMPWFYWFESKDAMIAAVRDHGLFLNPPRSDIDLAATQAELDAALGTDGSIEELRETLNRCLAGASGFTWIGTFKELCESDSAAAKEVRANFRDSCDKGVDDGPIKSEEMSGFVEMIASYGV